MVTNENAITLRGIKLQLLSTKLKEILENKGWTPKKPNYSQGFSKPRDEDSLGL